MYYSEKENFVRAIRWDSPSHVPNAAVSKGVCYHGAWPGDSRPSRECKQWRDIWGAIWTDADGEVFPTGPAIGSIDELSRLIPPDPAGRMDKAREFVESMDREQYFLSVGHPYFLYENGLNVLGPEEFLASLLSEPEAAHEFLDMLLNFELAMAAEYVKFKPEHINTSDDYGMQDRLAVSPECWREFFKPRLKRIYDFYRSELGDQIVISHHSCGHVMPILEDFIELGVDIINPIQTTANDLAEMRRITSGRLVLAGGIDGQQILPHGSPEQVRAEVFKKLDLLWEGGGYLPFAEKRLGVPEDNFAAMDTAIADWSKENVAA